MTIAAGDSLVGVAWGGAYFIRFSVSHDCGQSFSPHVVVEDSGAINLSELLWKKGIFFISWRGVDGAVLSGGEDHIHFTYSIDKGQSFVPYVEAVTSDTVNYSAQSGEGLAINEEGKVFVVFTDTRYDCCFDLLWYLFVSVGTPGLVKGDLNFDGILTAADAVMELNAVFLGQPFPAPPQNADVNCDGKLTAVDAVLELNAVFLGTPFPCAEVENPVTQPHFAVTFNCVGFEVLG